MVRRSITDPAAVDVRPAVARRRCLRYARRMAARDEDIAWFRELLAPIGRITVRRMFGGTGLYADGMIVALEIEGTLYLKADDASRERFADAGGRPFVYAGKGRAITVRYWTPPDEAMDSPDAMRPWARLALDAALRDAAGKSGSRPRTPSAAKRPARRRSDAS